MNHAFCILNSSMSEAFSIVNERESINVNKKIESEK